MAIHEVVLLRAYFQSETGLPDAEFGTAAGNLNISSMSQFTEQILNRIHLGTKGATGVQVTPKCFLEST